MPVSKDYLQEVKDYHHQYHIDHQEVIKARAKKWYEDHKEEALAKSKIYREKEKPKIKKRRAAYYLNHKPEIQTKRKANYDPKKAYARVIAWRKANPEKYKALSARGVNRRRALKLATQVEKVDYEAIKADAKGICGICLLPIIGKFEYDHIIPLSKGGPHTTENHQLTHPSCNRKKSAKLV